MLPPVPGGYAASQAVAPLAKFAPQVVGAAFHELMSWLNAAAPLNMKAMVVTFLVSNQSSG